MRIDWDLYEWIMSHHALSNLQYQVFSLAPWLPNYKCVVISLFEKKKVHGFGVHTDFQVALAKACSEAIERACARELGTSTNGFSAHTDQTLAKINSWRELIERDAFLWSWHFGGGVLLTNEVIDCGIVGKEKWHFREIFSADPELKVGIAALERENGGYIVGAACSSDLNEALQKAVKEVSMVRAHQETYQVKPLSLDEFMKIERHTPEHHLQLSLDPDYGKKISTWLNTKSSSRPILKLKPEIEEIAPPRAIKSSLVKVVRAKEPLLMSIYFGPAKYPGLPHPMG